MAKANRITLKIQSVMAEKNMTYADIAERMTEQTGKEIKQAAVGARITGNPSLSALYEIADALGVKVTELFPDDDQYLALNKAPQQGQQTTITCPYCEKRFALLS